MENGNKTSKKRKLADALAVPLDDGVKMSPKTNLRVDVNGSDADENKMKKVVYDSPTRAYTNLKPMDSSSTTTGKGSPVVFGEKMEFVTPPNPGTAVRSRSSVKRMKRDDDTGVIVRRRSVRNLNLLWQ